LYLSDQIAAFLNKMSLKEVPHYVRSGAKHSILDCLGVMVAGANETTSRLITEFEKNSKPSGEATIIAKGIKASPLLQVLSAENISSMAGISLAVLN